jgi:hypothetical protein
MKAGVFILFIIVFIGLVAGDLVQPQTDPSLSDEFVGPFDDWVILVVELFLFLSLSFLHLFAFYFCYRLNCPR